MTWRAICAGPSYKEDSDRRHAEVSAKYEEARTAKDQAVKALDASQSLVATNEKETANAISDLRLEAGASTRLLLSST